MKYVYNKLVRDNIPSQINNQDGRKAKYKILEDEEYIKELNKKLLEESHEFIEDNKPEELADIMEVIENIMRVKNISWDEVSTIKKEKKDKKGGFTDKIYLEYVEEEKRNIEEEKELNKSWRSNLKNQI